MIVLNRKQNDMKLFFFDVKTGGSRQVMEETSHDVDRRLRLLRRRAGPDDLPREARTSSSGSPIATATSTSIATTIPASSFSR